MFGLSMGEMLIILVVVVVLFGSSRLAGLGKSAGKSVREFDEQPAEKTAADADAADDKK